MLLTFEVDGADEGELSFRCAGSLLYRRGCLVKATVSGGWYDMHGWDSIERGRYDEQQEMQEDGDRISGGIVQLLDAVVDVALLAPFVESDELRFGDQRSFFDSGAPARPIGPLYRN